MELKASLSKPCMKEQKYDFIIKYNRNLGYEIRETDQAWEAWGDTVEEELVKLKASKQAENISKCNEKRYGMIFTIEVQDQECEFDSTEQTERDLMKAFMATADGVTTYDNWVTNNYIVLNLTHEDVLKIYAYMNASITPLYSKQMFFASLINEATTVEELNRIIIDYDIVIPVTEEQPEAESEEDEFIEE